MVPHRRRAAVALLVAALALAWAAGARAEPAAWALLDGFEAPDWPDPGLWQLLEDPASAWAPSTCQAKAGRRALRAFAERGGAPVPCDAAVPPGSLSQAVMRLDLRAADTAQRLDLFFDLWLALAPDGEAGVFVHLRLPDADGGTRRVPVFGATAQSGTWVFPMRRLDLMNLDDIGDPGAPIDLRGGLWELEWSAYAPAGAPPGGGAFLDNVSLVWEPDPAVPTPTTRPTGTATATATATPTASATPSPTPTATATALPVGLRAYLPLGLDGAALLPPATPTPEKPLPFALFLPSLKREAAPTATPGPILTAPATAEPVDTVVPTPARTATPTATAIETPTLTALEGLVRPGGRD